MDREMKASRSRFAVMSVTAAVMLGAVNVTAQQVPKAVPIAEPVDEKAPPRAMPVEDAPKPKPPMSKGPDEDLYDYAILCYSQKDYQLAIKPFSDYIRSYPQGSHAAEVWFRLGESYLKTNQNEDADRAYLECLKRFPKTESSASAAYRMGAFAYNQRDFERAAQYFETCERGISAQDIKLVAMNNKALSLKVGGFKTKALAAYKALAAITVDNPYRESALVELATGLLEAGKKQEALNSFTEIISLSRDNAVLGDSYVKAGLIQNELDKGDLAIKSFQAALALRDLPADKRGIAVFGLIQAAYAKGDYATAVKTYNANPTSLAPEDVRPKELLLIGMAQKHQQSYRSAVEIFLTLEKNYPDSSEAFEAGYQKLLCFFQLADKDIIEFAERFESRYSSSHKDHEYITMSRLIRADWFFGKTEYKKAAEAYSGITMQKVPAKVRSSVLYKKGFAEAESGLYNDGISTLSSFISEYPKDDNMPLALAQRGVCRKAVHDFPNALTDFGLIIKEHPEHAAAEMAYYQSALIKSETRDVPGMIADFESLVAKFPKSAAAGEAWYRIGRGYFDQKQKETYAKAIEPLRKSIAGDPVQYLDKSSQLIISCQYLREDLDGLAKEVDAYLGLKKDASISPAILTYMGKRYYDAGNYAASVRYLNKATTPDEPGNTQSAVWNYLGLAELEAGHYDAAIKALDNYLAQTPEGAGRAKALLSKGRALLALSKFEDAGKAAQEGLAIAKEGKLHAQLQILEGDISMAHGDALAANKDNAGAKAEWLLAASNYVVISQIFVDPEITPEAAEKAAKALDKLGDKKKADALRSQLASKYPNFKAR
jgi:TolA-binding protein